MTEVILTSLIGIITTVISSVVTWTLARRKYNSEVDNNNIKNMSDSLEFYKRLSDDNTKRLDSLLEKNKKLGEEINFMKTQMIKLASSICIYLTCKVRQLDSSIINDVIQTHKEDNDDKDSSRQEV